MAELIYTVKAHKALGACINVFSGGQLKFHE